jgi:D-sedoheptulose 7-phosphate isomerase
MELANQRGARTVAFTGFDGGKLRSLAGIEIHVPSHCIEHVEDIHLMLEHLITKALKGLNLTGQTMPVETLETAPLPM